MIDYAEALTVIDVNSGSFVGRGKQARLEDTITKTNLEAAEAVVNQLRLRDIGGIIVIDFIDMARARNRDAVMKMLRDVAGGGPHEDVHRRDLQARPRRDDAPERHRGRARDHVPACPTCDGEGVIRSEETIAIEFERRMRDLGNEAPEDVEAFLVQMNPRVSAQFTGNGARVLHALEEGTGKQFHFEGSEGLPLDHFAVTMEGTRDEVEERAVPFREGDEVLVHIVEPHMYNVDDAVAKIDGYIVSVAGAAPLVGRSGSCASSRPGARPRPPSSSTPRAPPGQPGAAKDSDDGQTAARRRGRRGGRRRSRATADAGAPPES